MSGTASDDTLEGPVTPSTPFGPGTYVGAGRYKVVRAIASGAMGDVHEVEDVVLGVTIALKVLRAEIAGSSVAVERLRREIALARRVTHPNVCRIHDLGEHEGRVFITMELLSGETLAARLRRGPLGTDSSAHRARARRHTPRAARGRRHRDFKSRTSCSPAIARW
jgi:serine/threonine-protein kinase